MNIVLEQDTNRYAGGVPSFQKWYRKAQAASNPIVKNGINYSLKYPEIDGTLSCQKKPI